MDDGWKRWWSGAKDVEAPRNVCLDRDRCCILSSIESLREKFGILTHHRDTFKSLVSFITSQYLLIQLIGT